MPNLPVIQRCQAGQYLALQHLQRRAASAEGLARTRASRACFACLHHRHAFRRVNVVAIVVALDVDTESAGMCATVTIDDCEFYADRVLLKIRRALQQDAPPDWGVGLCLRPCATCK